MQHQHKRALWHDYREPGVYMLTVVAETRDRPFGSLTQQPDGSVEVSLTTLGEAVRESLLAMEQQEEAVEVLRAVVMPDHIHIVLQVHKTLTKHLGALVRAFKHDTTVAYLRALDARYGGTHRIRGSRPSASQRRAAVEAAAAAVPPSAKAALTKAPIMKAPIMKADEPPSTQPLPPESSPRTAQGPVEGGSSALINPPANASSAAISNGTGGSVEGGPSALTIPPANAPLTPPASALINPLASAAPSEPITLVAPLWSSGYHDRLLYGRGQLSRMLHYVTDNPRRGWIKHQHRDLFYNKRILNIPLTMEQARWLLREARRLGAAHELQDVLCVELRAPGASEWQPFVWWQPGAHADTGAERRAHLCVKAMGNLFLLDESLLLAVRLSRSTGRAELEKKKHDLLERCEREGAVIVTPAVSPGEEEVMSATLEAGYRFIRFIAGAMSDVYAPGEAMTEALARGQLLLLAPWPDRPQSARPGKGIFEVQNLLSILLASR